MSTPVYSFLPWLRSGVANSITSADLDAAVHVRAQLPIDLTVTGTKLDGSTEDQVIHRDINLYGPGDVVGIERRAVVKVEPQDWSTNFEPNYLPYIDFYDEDFPWRYTPAAADIARDRLRPWIALVVLEKDVEFTEGKDIAGKPLPYFELVAGIDTTTIFPSPTELWAWAHVHVNTDLSNNGDRSIPGVLDKLQQTIASNPDLAYSRVLCPRRLKPDTDYHAFLIPSFETGRLAGLGLDIADTTMATASAWDNHQAQFPYYYRWYFKTGDFGDFEYLVRLLQPRPVDKRVGTRDIDTMRPGSNLPVIDVPGLDGVLKLGGALQVPFGTLPPEDQAAVTKADQWDVPFPHAFETAMAALVDLADDYTRASAAAVNPDGDPDPVVTPPLYGRWPALVDRLLKAADGTALPDQQAWIHRLNLDPRFRVAAGLGTEVIQANDQKLMAAAWQQIGDVIAANDKLRLAQLAHAATSALFRQHLSMLPAEHQFLITAPLHARIMGSPTTVAAKVRASAVPAATTSGAFRRLTRQGTALARHLALPPHVAAAVVSGINDGRLLPAPPKTAPTGAIGIGEAAGAIQPSGEPSWIEKLLEKYPWLRFLPIVILLIIGLTALIFGPAAALIAIAVFAPIMRYLFKLLTKWSQAAQLEGSIREEQATPASVDQIRPVSNFVITRPGTAFVAQPGTTDSVEAAHFKQGLRDVYTFTSVQFPKVAPIRLQLPQLTSTVMRAIDPATTIPSRLGKLIYLPPWLIGNMVETFTPCMAYPVFDMPMYKPLTDLSSELFLPNINLIPQNSITLLESNQRFIESYMVGLNHEMARELLWNEYPTDQRGSYFRQFWDVTMQLPANPSQADREKLRDIPELHRWPRASALGSHNQRADHGEAALLVLVIRGELLKRYPTAVIYAQKAKWHTHNGAIDVTANRELIDLSPAEEDAPPSTKIRKPLFEAKVDPDIYFLGFDLTATEARGGTKATDDPGWFFVIKERPGEPRFGMDDVPAGEKPDLINWNDLAWVDVGTAPGTMIHLDQSLSFVPDPTPGDGDEPNPDDAQAHWNPNTTAAQLAYILYQVPVLVAVHASRMLP